MPEREIRHTILAAVSCVIILTTFSGCGKRVAGSSGDASSTRKSTAAPVETIQPEGFATIPDDKSSFETMRTPGDMASAPSETSPPLP